MSIDSRTITDAGFMGIFIGIRMKEIIGEA